MLLDAFSFFSSFFFLMYNHNEWLRRKNERRGSDPGLIGKLPQLPLSVLHSSHTFTRSYIQITYLSLLRLPPLSLHFCAPLLPPSLPVPTGRVGLTKRSRVEQTNRKTRSILARTRAHIQTLSIQNRGIRQRLSNLSKKKKKHDSTHTVE